MEEEETRIECCIDVFKRGEASEGGGGMGESRGARGGAWPYSPAPPPKKRSSQLISEQSRRGKRGRSIN